MEPLLDWGQLGERGSPVELEQEVEMCLFRVIKNSGDRQSYPFGAPPTGPVFLVLPSDDLCAASRAAL